MRMDDKQIMELWLQSQLEEAQALVRDNRAEVLTITVGQRFDHDSSRDRELLDAVGLVAVHAVHQHLEIADIALEVKEQKKESRMFLPENDRPPRSWKEREGGAGRPTRPAWIGIFGRGLMAIGISTVLVVGVIHNFPLAAVCAVVAGIGLVMELGQ